MKLQHGYLFVPIVAAMFFLSTVGCAGEGVRKLTEVEQNYFIGLQKEVNKGSGKFNELLENYTAVNEEVALREIARLKNDIRRARVVYSVREVLTAPASNRAEFIQKTRNKVILYHLAEASQAENVQLSSQLEIGRQHRKQLNASLQELAGLVKSTIESNKVLYNHLDKSVTEQLEDVMAEVGRQVTAFNQGLKDADQSNPVIQRMTKVGENAEKRTEQADNQLTQFIGIWGKLNNQKE